MKTKLLVIAVVCTVIVLFIMSFIGQQNISDVFNPLDQLSCGLKGGDYFMTAEYFVCRMPVGDEGKSCTDSEQCQDICKANTEDDTDGICTVFSHGCDIVLVEGKQFINCSFGASTVKINRIRFGFANCDFEGTTFEIGEELGPFLGFLEAMGINIGPIEGDFYGEEEETEEEESEFDF